MGIFVFIIVASFVLFERAQASVNGNFNLVQYVGPWYQTGLLLPETPGKAMICEWFDVKEDTNCTGCFEEKYRKLPAGGGQPRTTGFGFVKSSRIQVIYPDLSKRPFTFIVTSFNNGTELILEEANDKKHSKMLSLYPIFSSEVEESFTDLARVAGLHPVFVNSGSCVL